MANLLILKLIIVFFGGVNDTAMPDPYYGEVFSVSVEHLKEDHLSDLFLKKERSKDEMVANVSSSPFVEKFTESDEKKEIKDSAVPVKMEAEAMDIPKDIPLKSTDKDPDTFHEAPGVPSKALDITSKVPEVPFYSQKTDIDIPEWRGRACGVASLAMIVEFYYPGKTDPQKLLNRGLDAGHYLYGIGWTHRGLSLLAREQGLKSESYDLSSASMEDAYIKLLRSLERGPLIASVFHRFDPQSPIPHLVVINGIKDGLVYFNDPAWSFGGETISVDVFKKGWKKRFITAYH